MSFVADQTSAISVRSMVITLIEEIAAQHRKTLAPLSDGVALLDSGLDSLCIAVLVASLDDRLDVDPFGEAGGAAFPVTIGEFITLYERAAG